ncbi:MAG: SGNH/GDSL hydrolase family protein [Holophagales bacterium]|nr:SGNH/GDSL hydrolase family protein [Holophagales bacterium]
MKNTLLAALAVALAVSASPAAAQADFTKFVVVGASVDSGFIDSCWVKHGQTDSWPAIFARQTGISGFQQPIVGEPGLGPCQILTSLAPTFSYAPNTGKPENLTLARPYDNLAIPGYLGASVVNCKTATADVPCKNALIDLVLRGSGATVLQQAASLKPTFFAIGVLGNELLGPATQGTAIDGVTLMSKEAYAASYKTIVDTMKAAQGGTGKGIAATVPDVTTLPYFTAVSPIIGLNPSTGAPIYVLGPTGCPTGVPACPVPAGTVVPLPLGSLMKLGYGIPCAVAPTLPKCNTPLPDNATLIGTTGVPGLLYPGEVSLLKTRGTEYNAQIKTLAEGAGYKVFDTAALLADIAAHGREYAGMTLTSAYLSGGVFSYDGVHPSATGYAIVADALVQFVNANYGSSIPRVNMAPYLLTGNSSGGFPTSSYGPPTQEQIIEFAAAYFTPEVLENFWQTLGVPTEDRGLVLGNGDDELPMPVAPRRAKIDLTD